FRHLLANHVYIDISGCPAASNERPFASAKDCAVSEALRLSVASGDRVQQTPASNSLAPALRISRFATVRQLHVMHSWGGGLARWVKDYCLADSCRDNYLVKSIGDLNGFGQQLWLYRSIEHPQPLRRWILDPMIPGTATRHEGYAAAIQEL